MKIILIFIVLTGMFAAPAHGDLERFESLVSNVVASMDYYRNNFPVNFLDKLNRLKEEEMNRIRLTSSTIIDLTEDKLIEAGEKAIHARSCLETLSNDLSEIVFRVHLKLTPCMDIAMRLTRDFIPLISQHGVAGDEMLRELGTAAAKLAKTPPNEAGKCYRKFDRVVMAASFGYERTTKRLLTALDSLEAFLEADINRCFQGPVNDGRRAFKAIREKVLSCIAAHIHQH